MKKSRKLTLMTVAMAEKIRKMEVYKGQRPYDSKHAYELGDKMKDGRFLTGQVAICHEEDNPKKSTLLDGQHCIGGCIKSKSPFDCLYYEFVVERKDSVPTRARLFAQFEGGKSRSRKNIAWCYAVALGWFDWPKRCISLCNTGLCSTTTGEYSAYYEVTKDEAGELMQKRKKDCMFIHDIVYAKSIPSKGRKHLERGPVIAAMMMTRRANSDRARDFWISVRDGENLVKTSPMYTLRDLLRDISIKSWGGAKSNGCKEDVTGPHMYSVCIRAWNTWIGGRKKFSTKEEPDVRLPKPLKGKE